jgi:hypothetical protein
MGSNGYVKIDLNEVTAEARLHRGKERSPLFRTILKWSIIKGLEKKEIFSLHSSSVFDGSQVRLFVGRSGSGKTSTLLLFLLNGHKMIADDAVFFEKRTLYPFSMRVTLDPETVRRLRSAFTSKSFWLPEIHEAKLIDLGPIFETQTARIQPSSLSLFFLNIWNSRTSKLRRIDAKKGLGLLLGSYLAEMSNSYWSEWNKIKVVGHIMKAYTSLLDNTECFEVFAGSDQRRLYRLLNSV